MSDSKPRSHQRPREGFERRWIKNANYTGPERRSGVDRRRYPPVNDGEAPQTADTGEKPDKTDDKPPAPNPSGTFKPYRP
jgi:hypothetical protein